MAFLSFLGTGFAQGSKRASAPFLPLAAGGVLQKDRKAQSSAFTIVELLIVVVVVAILAAVTIVAYNGITNRAKSAGLQADVTQAGKILEAYKLTSGGSYPADCTAAEQAGLKSCTSFGYYPSGKGYCLQKTDGSTTYSVSNVSPTIAAAPCHLNGLVGQWTLNGNANDVVGGVSGTVTAATLTTGQNGQASGAYSFNGSSAYITLASAPALELLGQDFTVSAWVNLATLPVPGTYKWYSIMGGISGGWSVGIADASGTGVGYLRMTKNDQSDAPQSSSAVTQNTWRHVTFVYIHGSPATVSYYISGSAVGSSSWNYSSFGQFQTGAKGLGLKRTNLPIAGHFLGALDDVRVYGRALSASEIQAIYTSNAQ